MSKPPRAKKGQQASSASRAADLLNSSAASAISASAAFGSSTFGPGAAAAAGGFTFAPPPAASFSSSASSFSTLESNQSSPSSSSASSSSSPSSDEFRISSELVKLVFKRLTSKRDTTTKLKGLDELLSHFQLEYCSSNSTTNANNADSNAAAAAAAAAAAVQLKAILSVWRGIYSKLGLDVDAKVRQKSNRVLATLLTAIDLQTGSSGKKTILTPFLKDLLAVWMVCQFDTHRDVVRVAKDSFIATFPTSTNVLSMYQSTLISFAAENILNQTVQSMTDPRFATEEEMRAKYCRVISGSVSVLSLLMETLQDDALAKLQTDVGGLLLDKQKFWDMVNYSPASGNNSGASIRRSVFHFIKTCCIKCPDVLSCRLNVIAPIFPGSLFASNTSSTTIDTSAYPDMWDSLLLLSKREPQIWSLAFSMPSSTSTTTTTDPTKKQRQASSSSSSSHELGPLLQSIQSGCHGTMLISFPCILPLLSCLSNTPLLNGITISATTTLSNYNEEKLSTNVVEAVAAQIMDALWKSAVHVMDSATSRVWETTYFEVCIWLSLHLQKQQQLQHGSSTDNDSTTATSTAGDQSKITSTPSIALLSKYITRALDAYLVPSKFRDIQNKLQWEDGCSRLLVAAGYTGKLYREGLLVQGILDPISGTLTAALARMDIMTREGMQLFASRIGCLVKDLYSHVVKDSSSSGGVRSGAEVDVLAMIHASVSSCIARLSSPPSADSDTSSSKDIDHASNLTSNQFIYSLLSHFSSAAPVSNELSQFTYANVPRLISLNVNHLPTVQSLLEIAVNTLLITDSSNLDANKALFTDLVQRLSGGGVGEGTMFYKHLLFLLKLLSSSKLAKNVTDDIGLDLITDSLYQQISTSRIAETDVSVGLDIIAECLCAGDHVPMFMNKEKISNLFDTISYFICTYTTLYMKPTTTPATLSKHHDGIAASITLFDKAVSVDRLWNENILIRHKESLASLFDLFTFMDEDDLSPYQTEGIGSSGNNVNSPHHPLSAIVPLVKRVWDKIEYRLKALQHQNEDDFQSIIFALAHSWRRNVLMEDHIGRPLAFAAQLVHLISLDAALTTQLLEHTCTLSPSSLSRSEYSVSLSMVEPLFIFIPSSMPSEHRIEPIIISEHVRLRYIRVMYSLAEYLGAGKLFGVYKLGGAVVVEMIRSIVRSVYASPTRSITHNSLMEVDELDNIPELKTAVEALVDSYFAKLVTSTPSVANLHGEILTVISSYILKSNIPVSSTSTTGTFSRILDACLANAINDTSSLTSVENIIIFKTCLDKILGLFPLDDTSPEHLAILEKWDVLLTGEIVESMWLIRASIVQVICKRFTSTTSFREKLKSGVFVFSLKQVIAIKESPFTTREFHNVLCKLNVLATAFTCTRPTEVEKSQMDGLVTKLRSFYGAGGILKIELMDAGACTLHAEALSILKRVLDIKECRTGMPISSARFIAEFCLKFIQSTDVSIDSHKILFYRGLALLDQLKACASASPDIWAVPELEKPILKKLNAAVMNVFLEDLACAKNPFLGGTNHSPLNNPAITLFENYIAEQCEQLSEDILFDIRPFEKLYSLMFASNFQVQRTAYQLIKQLTVEFVQVQSINAEMQKDGEDAAEQLLPELVLKSISRKPSVAWRASFQNLHLADRFTTTSSTFGYLLSWMALFDHFEDLTFQLKVGYIAHLRSLDAEFSRYLETLFTLLRVGSQSSTAVMFDLSKWDYEFYMVQGFDETSEFALPLFASHLLWRTLRTVPTLVRTWWSQCKNRQLTLATEKYIERYFTPTLVARQVSALNESSTSDSSSFEGLTIKASATSSVVTAIYEVEDATLEMVIRIPSNFPLRQVEIESGGGSRVGVPENKWRGWLLSSTAVLIAQNGTLADAVAVFRKNITSHFEGVEDCAVCYSVIGPLDRTIPSKQCKTCKHKYHGACLYKWFKSSNAATCPLCRQLF